MLYVLYGTDTAHARNKLSKLIEGLLIKRPDAPLIRIEAEKYEPEYVESQIGGQGLFAPRSIIVLDSIFKKADIREHFSGIAEAVAGSDNVFVCVDEVIEASMVKILEKYATKIEEHSKSEIKKDDHLFLYTFTDAVGSRSRGLAWVRYMEARRKGFSVEEIHHKAFWQVKNMMLAKKAKSHTEVGMKEFPFKKSRDAGAKWSAEELQDFAAKLISQNHDQRRGLVDLELSFERLLLSI